VCETPTARKIRRVIQASSVGRVTAKTFLRVKDARRRRAHVRLRAAVAYTTRGCMCAIRNALMRHCIVRACVTCVRVYVPRRGLRLFSCRRLSSSSFVSRVSRSAPFFSFSPRRDPHDPTSALAFSLPLCSFSQKAEKETWERVSGPQLRGFPFSTSATRRRHVIMRQTSGDQRRSAIFMGDRVNLLGNT